MLWNLNDRQNQLPNTIETGNIVLGKVIEKMPGGATMTDRGLQATMTDATEGKRAFAYVGAGRFTPGATSYPHQALVFATERHVHIEGVRKDLMEVPFSTYFKARSGDLPVTRPFLPNLKTIIGNDESVMGMPARFYACVLGVQVFFSLLSADPITGSDGGEIKEMKKSELPDALHGYANMVLTLVAAVPRNAKDSKDEIDVATVAALVGDNMWGRAPSLRRPITAADIAGFCHSIPTHMNHTEYMLRRERACKSINDGAVATYRHAIPSNYVFEELLDAARCYQDHYKKNEELDGEIDAMEEKKKGKGAAAAAATPLTSDEKTVLWKKKQSLSISYALSIYYISRMYRCLQHTGCGVAAFLALESSYNHHIQMCTALALEIYPDIRAPLTLYLLGGFKIPRGVKPEGIHTSEVVCGVIAVGVLFSPIIRRRVFSSDIDYNITESTLHGDDVCADIISKLVARGARTVDDAWSIDDAVVGALFMEARVSMTKEEKAKDIEAFRSVV